MATVTIRPLHDWERKLTRYRPMHPPIFMDGVATDEDRLLAIELFLALDPESQAWYGGQAFIDRQRDGLAGC